MAMNVGELFATLKLDSSQFDSGLNSAQSGFSKMGASLTAVGAGLTAGITTPIAGIATQAIKTVTQFDDSMSKLKAITGATGKEFDTMREKARELGSTTQFTAQDAAEGMTFLGQAGWNTQQIMSGMPGVLNLAAAGGLNLAQTSDILVNVMGAMGIAAKDSGKAADVLALAASATNTDVYLMGESMKYAAPIAKQMGLSIEEASAMIGLMSNAGIKGSEAGTALRAGLIRLAAPTGETSKMMKKLGMEFTDANGNMLPMGEILKRLKKDLDGMDESTRMATASQLFGMEAASGWLAVLDMGPDKFDALTKSLEDSTGTAEEMAKTMQDNIGGSFRELESAVEGALITIGDKLKPVIREAADFISGLVNSFTNLNPSIQNTIMIFAGVAAAIGPIILAMGALSMAIGAVGAPIAAAVAAIGLLVAGFISAYTQCESFRTAVNTVLTAVKDLFMVVFNAIADVVKTVMADASKFFGEQIAKIKSFWDENGAQIQAAVEKVFNAIKAVIEFVMPYVKQMILDTWTVIKSAISGAIDVILGVIKVFSAALTGDWKGVWDGIKQIASGMMEAVSGIFKVGFLGTIVNTIKEFVKVTNDTINSVCKWISDTISSMVNAVVGFFKNLSTQTTSTVKSMWSTIQAAFNAVVGPIKTIVSSLWQATIALFTGNTAEAKKIIDQMWTNIKTAFNNAVNMVKAPLQAVWNSIKSVFSNMASDAIQWGRNLVDGFIDGIKQMGQKAANAAKDIMNQVSDYLQFWSPSKKGPGRYIVHWGRNMVDGFLDGVGDMKGEAGAAVSNLMSGIEAKMSTPDLAALAAAAQPAAMGSSTSNTVNNHFKLETNINGSNAANSPAAIRRQQERLMRTMELKWGMS